MLKEVWYMPSEDFPLARKVRMDVFVHEQKYTHEEEFDKLDKESYHLVLTDETDAAVATARLYKRHDGVFVPGRIAVQKEMRGKNIGKALMQIILEKGLELGASEFEIGAQSYAVPFYERLGFTAYGDEYLEGSIPHTKMKRREK